MKMEDIKQNLMLEEIGKSKSESNAIRNWKI